MNVEAFISSIEDEWKEIPTRSKEHYRRMAGKFSDDDRARILEQILIKCRYTPKIADIYSAADDLLIKPERRQPATKGCRKCEGTTWIYVTCTHPQSGRKYQAVKPCSCTPRNIKFPPNPFGDVPKDDEVPF